MTFAAGAAVASKAEDSRIVVSTLPAQAAAGENGRPDAYVQAPQGLFPAPLQQSKAAGVRPAVPSLGVKFNAVPGRLNQTPIFMIERRACLMDSTQFTV